MRRLWAPWREAYISGARRPEEPKGCLFCRKGRSRAGRTADQVLVRGPAAFSLLNKFPYNNGHMLVAPYRHVARINQLSEEEWLDLWRLADDAIARLGKAVSPHGYNLGINLGRAAGAGIPDHLHLHIVPRWVGDTNFMPALSNTKIISQSLKAAYRVLKKAKPQRAPRNRRRRG
ncbi:MAG: HIT domain-containing protein [Candidatus Omnitrophica bacterium]|nr:HIT domain-containing protein [Candidatus Omnitrophota bacterium]